MVSRAWLLTVVYHALLGGTVIAKERNNVLRGRHKSYYNERPDSTNTRRRRANGTERLSRTTAEKPETNDPNDKKVFPFLVSLMDESFNHICGGSLIARDMVLTAASCQDKAILTYVHFQDDTIKGDETVEIRTAFRHPEYNEVTREHNTMLVQINSPVEPLVSSPSLPSASTIIEDLLVQVILTDVDSSRPSKWPVPILKEGQTLIGFNHRQSTRYSNDEKDNREFDNEWGNWKLGYIGIDSCRQQSTEKSPDLKEFFANDSFCLDRRDVQLLSSNSSSSDLCQPGEVGGPILWMSDTTNARLQLGVNTWGIGCRSSGLPDVAGFANLGGNFIRNITCAESQIPPSYMRCQPTATIMIVEEKESPSSSKGFSKEFSALFGAAASKKTTKNLNLQQVADEIEEASAPDPVTVYMLFLFDSTTSEYISWTVHESISGALIASAQDGSYESATDTTELLSLLPGVSYNLSIVDGSSSAIVDRVGGTTKFAIVVSEPPQKVAKGQIASGTARTFAFQVPISGSNGTSELDEQPEVQEEIITALELEVSTQAPATACAEKGDFCKSNGDCCSDRCSPSKQCAAAEEAANRKKVSSGSGGHGGSAAGVIESTSRQFDY